MVHAQMANFGDFLRPVFQRAACMQHISDYYYYYIRFSRTTWVSRHQKGAPVKSRMVYGKPFWILLEQEMMGGQWHQLDHM